ncbi:MAG: hypothetical protein ACPGXL_08290 [Chitinophagales bacterium]
MKRLITILLMTGMIQQATAQIADSLIYEADHIRITKNQTTDKFKITNKITGKSFINLKFVDYVFNNIQVLDGNNNVYFLSNRWEKTEEPMMLGGLCGTVPHYTASVKSNASSHQVMIEETFMSRFDSIPEEKIVEISTAVADSVLFINGASTFRFTANFNYLLNALAPKTIILKKDGKYFKKDAPEQLYDAIDFGKKAYAVQTKQGDLYGIFDIIEPKFASIEEFYYHLAKATMPDGSEVYIDLKGNEY